MLTELELRDLLTHRPSAFPVTSLYLTVEGSFAGKNDQRITVKDLIKERKADVTRDGHSREALDSIHGDFDRITRYLDQEFQRKGVKGLAVFSSTGGDLWKTMPLRHPVPDQLRIGARPVVRPLTVLLDDYRRFATVLVGKERARIFEVHLGEIVEHSEIFDEIQGKINFGGYQGYEEKRIERHHDDLVKKHFKAVSDRTLDFFRKSSFDRLVVGCHTDLLAEFEGTLHSYLRERLVAVLPVGPEIPVAEALSRTLAAIEEAEKRKEATITDRLLGDHTRAVVGLPASLKAISGREVDLVAIGKSLEAPGVACDDCHFLGVAETTCPRCGQPPRRVPEVAEEAIQMALLDGARIEHVEETEPFRKAGGIGALIRHRR